MTAEQRPMHLVERAEALLQSEAGLSSMPAQATPARPATTAVVPAPAAAEPAMAVLGAEARDAAAGMAERRERRLGHVDGEPQGGPSLPTGLTPPIDLPSLRRGGLVLSGKRTRATEEYRVTVARLVRTLRTGRAGLTSTGNLMMITSARPGEGKTFSALNIAASIAQNGLADVLLVDVDAKPRSLSVLLGLHDRPGLYELVANPALKPEQLIIETAVEGLWLLPRGTPPGQAGITHALSSTVERLSRRYPLHIIVLDTAPCLSTSDPSTLAHMVDLTVMIVQAEGTQRSELEAALELVKACQSISLVLNKIRLRQRHSFGSYYYFSEAT
jgi:receptor protein-tyrosine kinase